MNTTDNTPRKDPLIDAYHQASVREGARAGANLRAAVLAHARVVAQSLPSSPATVAVLSVTTRGKPAANESSPMWRLAAGVVVGVIGVWIFQLTRPADAPDVTVATVTTPNQPQAGKAQVAESTPVTQPPATAAAPETAVAVVAPLPAATSAAVDASGSRARADIPISRKPAQSPRGEINVAVVRAPPREERADLRAPVPFGVDTNASRSAAAATATVTATVTAAATDTNAGEIFSEVVVASAELRKSAKVAASPVNDQPAMAVATPRLSSAAPDAFPAQTATQSMPSSADAARPRSPPLDERDRAMFRALRVGDLLALRAAIARGANVNARDERGRTTLHIARERNDGALVDALQAAGAR